MNCYLCGASSDLRPYGERGQPICFRCMKASPEREAEAKRQFAAHLSVIAEERIVLTAHGPVPANSVLGGKPAKEGYLPSTDEERVFAEALRQSVQVVDAKEGP